MRELPCLMNGNGVRATLDGRKTQTRRPVVGVDRVDKFIRMDNDRAIFDSLPPISDAFESIGDPRMFISRRNPLGVPGDLLYVRETHCLVVPSGDDLPPGAILVDDSPYGPVEVVYRANVELGVLAWCSGLRWRSSIHMPKWAARLWLLNTDNRVEKGPYISETDARAEGFENAAAFMAWWERQYPGMDWRFVTSYEVIER